MLIKQVYQVILEYQVHAVIGLQGCASHFLKKRYPEIALTIKEDTEFADCILCNGVEEVSHRGNDFLTS